MNEKELIYAMALSRIPSVGYHWALELYNKVGNATVLYENYKDLRSMVPEVTEHLQNQMLTFPDHVAEAERELEFMNRFQIQGLVYGDMDYPCRLRECPDAPLVLFFKGQSLEVLNRKRIVSMVGTRRCTEYGKDLCRNFLKELAQLDKDILIVSGLAYGVDTQAHEQALQNGMDTVGVLAHGLDRIYPQMNRTLAGRMVEQGGLLTEYVSGTVPDAFNFVKRNRIVAGMSDCCIVVESKEKGGSLITADLSMGYGRDVFAFPGRVTDPYSKGCNQLIEQNGAGLLTTAENFVKQMRWEMKKPVVVQREMFPELSADEEKVADTLRGVESLTVNMLSVQCNIPVHKLVALLLELEMKGVVKSLVGGAYRLIT